MKSFWTNKNTTNGFKHSYLVGLDQKLKLKWMENKKSGLIGKKREKKMR